MTRKIINTIPFLLISILLSGCLSIPTGMPISENLQPGQFVSDQLCFVTGKIQIDIPDENMPSEQYKDIILGLEKEEGSPEILSVKLNEVFYKSIPKGKYKLRSLTYSIIKKPLNGAGIVLLPVNVSIENVEIDLSATDFAYLGDLHLTGRKNSYGNIQRSTELKDNSSEYNQLTLGWLLDENGAPVQPENESSVFSGIQTLEGAFPTIAEGYEIKAKEIKYIETEQGNNTTIDPAAKVAFVGVDDNFATREILKTMDHLALGKYNGEVLIQNKIQSLLPEYPALIYADNFTAEKQSIGSFTTSEKYDESFDAKAIELGETLGVDYLYILYHINGITYNTNDPSYQKQGLAIQMRGRLFSVNEKKSIAYSLIQEKEEIPSITGIIGPDIYRKAEQTMFSRIAEGVVEGLF